MKQPYINMRNFWLDIKNLENRKGIVSLGPDRVAVAGVEMALADGSHRKHLFLATNSLGDSSLYFENNSPSGLGGQIAGHDNEALQTAAARMLAHASKLTAQMESLPAGSPLPAPSAPGQVRLFAVSDEKLFHIDEPVYNYRVNMNTTVKDFINKIPNILDVIKCVENIETQMKERGLSEEYKSQIESLYILHTLFRVENAMFWVNFPHKKKEIVVSSLLGILDAKYPNWQENRIVELYKSKNALFNFDMNRLNKYTNEEYRNVDIETAESNIRGSFR